MNETLKTYLIEKGWVAEGASDEELQTALTDKLSAGELPREEYLKMLKSDDGRLKGLSESISTAVAEKIAGPLDNIAKALESFSAKKTAVAEVDEDDDGDDPTDVELKSQPAPKHKKTETQPDTILKMAVDENGHGNVRVKSAVERYKQDRRPTAWTKSGPGAEVGRSSRVRGQQMQFTHAFGARGAGTTQTLDEPSEAQWAMMGAYLKHMMKPAITQNYDPSFDLTEHEKQLLAYLIHEENWRFDNGKSIQTRRAKDFERNLLLKTVLDDATSGGQEAVPEFFDDEAIRTPLLHSELLPHVDIRTMSRGSTVEGYSIGTPTFVSTAEGSAVSEFSTTSFVADYSPDVYPATCALTFGLDFLSDAAPTFARAVFAQIGQEALRWADEQIAIGDGTTEPQGIMNASGNSVSSANGTAGPATVGDALNMIEGIDKAHRASFGGMDVGYVMNDVNYFDYRGLATGITGDTRYTFGNDVSSYTLFNYPVWIQNNMTNNQQAFCNLKAYRWYRRQGITFTTDVSGSTLRLSNEQLLVARMRHAGQLTLGTYVAQMTDASDYNE